MKKLFFVLLVFVLMVIPGFAQELLPQIKDIISNPSEYEGKTVSVTGFFSGWKNAPGAPPVSRSDWVICDASKNGIYCYGQMPSDEETGEIDSYWAPIRVLGVLKIVDQKPYIEVIETKKAEPAVETMVSVKQVILNPTSMQGQYVGLMGVLAKGYGIKGDRMYLIADPTGALRIGRMRKLYPKGTILHIKGYVTTDEYGMPMIDQVEVISAKVD